MWNEIPTNAKIGLFCLVSTLLGIFFVSSFIAHADVGEHFRFDRYEGATVSKNFGNTNDGYCQRIYNLSNSVYVASSTFRGIRVGTPTDYLYGVIFDNSKNVIATSTNWILGSTLSNSGAGYYVFYYDNVYFSSTTPFYICHKRSGAQSGTNYFSVTGDTNGISPSYGYYLSGTSTATTLAMQPYTQTWGYTFFPTCTGGEATSTMCDMASTTEAIYTVGYSINLILGIAIFIFFFYFGYKFIRLFI